MASGSLLPGLGEPLLPLCGISMVLLISNLVGSAVPGCLRGSTGHLGVGWGARLQQLILPRDACQEGRGRDPKRD